MKKTRNTSTKVVAISTVAVVALAGVSVVSLHSLAKNDEAVRAGFVSGMDADTASGKLGVRPDQQVVTPVVSIETDAVADAGSFEDESYGSPISEAEILSVDETINVVSSVVEKVEKPDEFVIVAQVAEALAPAVEEVPVLKIASQQVFLAPEETVITEAVAEDHTEYEETANLDVAVPDFEFEFEDRDRVDDHDRWEEITAEARVAEEAVYEEIVYEEPVYEEPEYVPEFTEEAVPEVYTEPESIAEETAAPEEVTTTSTSSGTSSSVRQALVDYAASRVGVTPYVWAGRSLETGTDCSGFVNLIYNNFGYYASAGSDDYQNVEGDWGTNISYDDLQIGDVVVYYDGGHVGIYAGQDENGNDLVIHDSNEIDGVKISEMDYSTPTAYVRIIDDDDEYTEDTLYSSDDDDVIDDEDSNDSDGDDEEWIDEWE